MTETSYRLLKVLSFCDRKRACEENSANFPGLKCSTMKHSLVSILITRAEKTASEVSYLWPFWSSNLKVSNSTMNGAVEIHCVRYTLS